ncbi:MAG: hydrogenobyrinic acid a,c-diamide synthase (glutamine-hydrolyzing) [Anaerolineae bacterium]|nr:hydrogenobyrinic acid a,c-diamide synthase (glutamine-hydrolyzing) [Anaerolineae bacterium]
MSSVISPEHPARLVLAAPQGRSGKTTVTLGLCAALAGQGLVIQPFKKGPDYIDPSWLTEAAGRPCRTLDPFFMISPESLRQAFNRGAQGAGLSLIEGNHGLYDSLEDDGSGSTAAVARALQTPVILVVNAARMSRSVAALVHGYQTFEPETQIAAVILNNVAQGRHETKLRRAIEYHCHLPVVGALPRSEALTIPDRHLGLIPRAENERLVPAVEACRQAAEQYLDLEAIVNIAHTVPALPDESMLLQTKVPARIRLGVIRDRAFTFYYPENLEALVEAGAELVFINALSDPGLPPIDALYIGGGFPEMFMEELAANTGLRYDIRAAAEAGLPIYAECGGLIYLARRIIWQQHLFEMVGALPCDVEMTSRPQGHGYVLAETKGPNPFLPLGATMRGHEFHHSRVVNLAEEITFAYRLARGQGCGSGCDGLVYRNILAAYTHLHAAGSPGWAAGLVARAETCSAEATYAPL